MTKIRFEILNDTAKKVDVQIEPEGWLFSLESGESVAVLGEYQKTPITVQLADDPKGGVCCAVIPGDGDVIVEKDGKNVLDDLV
jgi:hypothetical protein